VRSRSILRGLGKEVRDRRKRRKLTQEELAFDAEVHPNVIGRLERGIYNPTVTVLSAIAVQLKTPLHELFAGAAKRQ
jgi:transcriptional regulator with XRE-family HTH domain